MTEGTIALSTGQFITLVSAVCVTLVGAVGVLFRMFSAIVEARAKECREENAVLRADLKALAGEDRAACLQTLANLGNICSECVSELKELRRERREETDRHTRPRA